MILLKFFMRILRLDFRINNLILILNIRRRWLILNNKILILKVCFIVMLISDIILFWLYDWSFYWLLHNIIIFNYLLNSLMFFFRSRFICSLMFFNMLLSLLITILLLTNNTIDFIIIYYWNRNIRIRSTII